jgi:hypothetical protein
LDVVYDGTEPFLVTNVIVSTYAHPIIFAISLFSILWGGLCVLIVSYYVPAVLASFQRV